MKQELEQALIQQYPILYQDYSKDMTETCMCWGFECGNGWYDLINDLSKKIEGINNFNLGFKIIADQVKEKYGTLRFYYHTETDEGLTDSQQDLNNKLCALIDDAIELAGIKTEYTCEVCGKQGKLRNNGWIQCLCDEHVKKNNQEEEDGPLSKDS